ncbi:hypothetical protein BCR42DRAFT_486130 [Absidia repens]|uniref:BZIP domain-containing protein n=1 Tax=Absidia repens TaxID=90262 RepID=A0A1X2J2P0_9FUNG|nr:hypothetical protein BCR42DRAFT_486130 [Absidia repens]
MTICDSTMPHHSAPSNKKQSVGRHRIYTNEQRKDRNRQAQAAFRARRTLYTKTQKETIAELQHMVHMLQKTMLEANERASCAEKRCMQLENENQQLKTTLACFLAPSSSPSSCVSPLTSHSSPLLPTSDDMPLIYPQESFSWLSSPSSSSSSSSLEDPTTILLDECSKDHLESKFNPLCVDFLGEYSFILLPRKKGRWGVWSLYDVMCICQKNSVILGRFFFSFIFRPSTRK